MSKTKKILLIVAFIVLVIIIAFALYLVFFKPLAPEPDDYEGIDSEFPGGDSTDLITDGQLPSKGDKITEEGIAERPAESSLIATGGVTKVTALTQYEIYEPTISSDGSHILYYDPQTGKFYKMDSNGQSSLISNKTFYSVENITWAPNATRAVLEYPDGANIVYDFTAKKQYTLPTHWEEFNFSPDSNKIISKSIGLDPENRFLVVSNSDGTQTEIIGNLGYNNKKIINLWSPNDQIIALINDDLDLDRKEIYFIGKNNENFKSMVVEGWGFNGKWSPQGDKILYSVYNAYNNDKPRLWVSDANTNTIGRNRQDLLLNTWADKCAFHGNSTVYCAVPTTLETGAGMFPKEMDNSADVLYKIDLSQGTRTLIALPEAGHTMKNLMISADGSDLFYTDKFDGKLYKIRLK